MNRQWEIVSESVIDDLAEVLTSREIEYLSLVALGYQNYKIAEVLFVTSSTVKKTLENIFYKLDAIDRANAVAIAFVHEILTADIINQIIIRFKLAKPVVRRSRRKNK